MTEVGRVVSASSRRFSLLGHYMWLCSRRPFLSPRRERAWSRLVSGPAPGMQHGKSRSSAKWFDDDLSQRAQRWRIWTGM